MKDNSNIYVELGNPIEWVQYAEELHYSSEILYQHRDESILQKIDSNGKILIQKSGISRTYFLLIGFCMENLLKAYLIAKNPDYLKEGKIDKSISTNHSLIDLSIKLTEFNFSENELDLLRILSEGIPYWTRYPIPKRVENLSKERVLNEKIHVTFTSIFQRMRLDLYRYVNRDHNVWNDSELEKQKKK
jgi:AAA+ ATPase superfamily predicted ATPase